jgi:hypothetical protein
MSRPSSRATPAEAAKLTKSRLIAIKRLMATDGWKTFFDHLTANFPLDESVFRRNAAGIFDPLDAAVRDGNRTVLVYIREISKMPTPGDDDDATPPEDEQ